MIVRGADGAKRELFGLFDSSVPIPRPSQWGATVSHSGERVSIGSAAGLPAFLRGVRLISETAAGLPIGLYRGYGQSKKPVENASQLGILRRPNPDQAAFSVWSYTFASLLRGNAYLRKIKVRNQVRFLYPVNPSFVTPKYEGDRATFDLRDKEYGPIVKTVGKDQIIHIPGILLEDPYVGVSVVQAHRNSLGNELGRERFEGRYMANDGKPGAVLKHGGNPTKEQREEIRSGYEARHVGNAGRVGMMWGGWELDSVPVNLQDAQFIESKRYGVQDIGRMLGVPGGLLGEADYRTPESSEQENMKFLQHGLMPWMSRVEQGLANDIDLFAEPDWSVEFDEHGFLRADIHTRYDAYRIARQGGWITPNEIRRDEGRPPVEGGDEIQQTPVGGAVNQPADAANTNQGGGNNANAD